MGAGGIGQASLDGGADYRRRLIAFALVEGAVLLFVTLPVLLWLFVLPNGLSEADLTRYAIGILALQMVVSGLLLWKFRIIPGPPTENKDAR
jgi:hypothetical protein